VGNRISSAFNHRNLKPAIYQILFLVLHLATIKKYKLIRRKVYTWLPEIYHLNPTPWTTYSP